MSSLHPPKLISISLASATPLDLWTGLPGDPWLGQPWSWTCTATVTAQLHSDPTTTHPFQYGGSDIAAGDWVFTTGSGRVLRVRSVTSWTDPTIVFILEDVDRINQLSDPLQSGSAGISTGQGLLFSTVAGVPALYPMPDQLVGLIPSSAVAQISSRFNALRRGLWVEVVQVAHGFSVGTTVAVSGGVYVAVPTIPGSLVPLGVVTEVDDMSTGSNKFYFSPFGGIITVALAGGTLGAPVYRGSSGQLTLTPPGGSPAAVAVWIDSARVVALQSASTSSPPLTTQLIAAEALTAGQLVNMYNVAGAAQVRRAIATATTSAADGFVLQSVGSGQIATVQLAGLDGVLSGLVPGSIYFLDPAVPGGITATAPSTSGQVVQQVGKALTSGSLQFVPGQPILLT